MTKNINHTLIISGGSITHGGWPTWKNFVLRRYNINKSVNLAQLGLGNEVIINRAIIESQKVENPLLMVMLTNVDKWDWYVEKDELLSKLNKEKHTIAKVHDNDSGGYWSTGSHYPLYKETYKKQFYSSTYQLIHNINLILMLQNYAKVNNIPLLLLFDSPIFECFEQDLNKNPKIIPTRKLHERKTVKPFYNLISATKTERNLIGFCVDENIPWYHTQYKGHPGSTAHYMFAKKHIFPWADNELILKKGISDKEEIEYASKMNNLWLETNKE